MPNQVNDDFSIPDSGVLRKEAALQKNSNVDETIDVALERHQDALMQMKGVVMVGEGQDEAGQPTIVVGVKDQQSLKFIPKTIDGIKIITTVIGEVDAL